MKKRLLNIIPPLLGIIFFIIVIIVLRGELKHFHYPHVIAYITQLPFWRLILALLLCTMSYFALAISEALLFKHIKNPLPFSKTAFVSFTSTTFSHNIGYSIVSGGSVRFRFYKMMGVSTLEISSVIGLHGLFFWVGFLLIGGLIFLLEPLPVSPGLHLPFKNTLPIGILFFIIIILFYVAVLKKLSLKIRGWKISLPTFKISTFLVLVSLMDWCFAGSALYILLPPTLHITLLSYLGIYLLAQIVGVGSQVPGGLGVFETVFMALLGFGKHSSSVLGALLIYRVFYYLLPLIISAFLMARYELLMNKEKVKQTIRWIGRFFSWFAPWFFSIAAFLAGAIMLFSGAAPAIDSRMNWLNKFLPLPVIEISHFLGSLVAVGLIFLAIGLQLRLYGAYRLTIALLLAGIIFSLFKGFNYEEAIILALMLGALLPSRRVFYRKAFLEAIQFSIPWIASIVIVLLSSVLLVIFTYHHINYSHDLWWQFTFFNDAPRSMRAVVGALIFSGFISLALLLRPAPPKLRMAAGNERSKILPIIADTSETIANIALLGDKFILFSDDEKAFIMFGVKGRSWVVMGDPIGAEESRLELLWKFRELVDRYAGWPVFYEVSRHNLYHYVDMGLTLFKLGEEARTYLPHLTLTGKSNKWFRYITRHLENDGYRFEIIPADAVQRYMPTLKAISDNWLAHKNTHEKRFSQGYFKEEYLVGFPMALIIKDSRIVAFANIWETQNKNELSVDLMRHCQDAPEGTMDYLFIKLMEWGKEQQYKWFNLGMAPLSGMEDHPHLAPLWNKFGRFIYRHGERFYNFRGLQHFKNKFDPIWEPRYLASPGGFILPRILINISALISGGLKGVVSK